MKMRIGYGYDVHRLAAKRKLILGGLEIPFHRGLDGHSDADVLTHAVMDAVLGAMGVGDIGKLFPDDDPACKDADSLGLLASCVEIMEMRGYRLSNLDATIVAQRPKLAPYMDAMADNLAAVFGVGVDAVNIKATTEEKMGFTGTGRGIAAHCVCLLERGE